MSALHKEIEFENDICAHLSAHDWLYAEGDHVQYDRTRALFPADVLAWVQHTQPQAWETLAKNHGAAAEATLLDRLRKQAGDFDPAVRDRLIAGAMVPASLVLKAQKFRRWYRDAVLKLFDRYDVILAPATPCTGPELGQQTLTIGGVEMPLRPNVGIYTQPISFIGLPVVAVPVPLKPLPIAVQVIAAPWREDIALRIAHALEQMGVVAAPQPDL
jgi:Asp-tRNA(Asn)/Glu-tRNA(Gln) amidotransferase A subunit family amidase